MKTTDEYFCENGTKLHFTTNVYQFEFEGIQISLEGIPHLKNEETNELYLPQCARVILKNVVDGAKTKGLSKITISPPDSLKSKRFSYCNNLPFKYSALEYYFIPGLIGSQNDGFLVPVYFNMDVLNKYTQHPDYDIKILSSTYGNLSCKDEWHISFGINRNKSILMWLGDIDSLPDKEKYYLVSENIEPEFEIHSEFYDAQICVEWAESALESKVFQAREKLSDLFENKFGYKLFKLEGEISRTIADLQKPVFWENRHVAPVVESLNRIFVEALCEKSIKEIILEKAPSADVKGLKGLKLFSTLLSSVFLLENSDELMCPFFVLYDYRIVMCHLQSEGTIEEKMDSIYNRMNICAENRHNEEIYMAIFQRLAQSLDSIINHITLD
ncbi:hypothetical protein DLM_0886 [Aquitalea magnusonii]|uniref:Uncharacterized protein n=1 Tax=Aquitalea magnusonii TaxID=332411 RepID=A0A3G9GG72_9NEIS|nr:hypothetical protein [Aquitalea magnusonii]BBF84526.1 hypothetical protein DLM_0886 [Aquitalea magnusonii]